MKFRGGDILRLVFKFPFTNVKYCGKIIILLHQLILEEIGKQYIAAKEYRM